MIYKVFVEKKKEFDGATSKVKDDIKNLLSIKLKDFRKFIRYYVDGLSETDMQRAISSVFSETTVDNVYENLDF